MLVACRGGRSWGSSDHSISPRSRFFAPAQWNSISHTVAVLQLGRLSGQCRAGDRGVDRTDRQNFGVGLRLGSAIVGCFNCHHNTPRVPVNDIEMRGLQRLRGPASCLSTCTATAPRTTPFLRQLSTSTPLQHRSRPTAPRATSHLRQRNASTATTTTTTLTDAEIVDLDPIDHEPVPIDTDLVLPGERTEADLPDQITDAEYVPATSAEGLEEVGGLDGWWDRPGTWGESKRYQGFGPREKVMDKSMLEVLTRQALIEAVILHQHKRPSKVTLPGPEARREVLLAEITAGPDGEATIAPEVRKMVLALGRSKVERSGVAGETPAAEEQVAEAQVVEEITGQGLESEDVEDVAGEPAVVSHELNPVEARRLMKQWDSSWKKLTLENPVLKFWVGCHLRTAPVQARLSSANMSTARQTHHRTDGPPDHGLQDDGLVDPGVHHQPPRAADQDKEACRRARGQGAPGRPAQCHGLSQESRAGGQGEDGGSVEDYREGADGSRSAGTGHGRLQEGGGEEMDHGRCLGGWHQASASMYCVYLIEVGPRCVACMMLKPVLSIMLSSDQKCEEPCLLSCP